MASLQELENGLKALKVLLLSGTPAANDRAWAAHAPAIYDILLSLVKEVMRIDAAHASLRRVGTNEGHVTVTVREEPVALPPAPVAVAEGQTASLFEAPAREEPSS